MVSKQFANTRKVLVGDVLLPVQRQKKVKKSDYKNEGMIPVIDQSVDFIAGYTNVDDCKYKGELPVIIFGDHTRILKYVRFPFAAGADGTQVLKPSTEFDEKYFYYSLIALNLKNYGYERHFKYLKEEEIIWRPLPLQRKIANVLSAYDYLIENNSRRIKILEEMAQAIYQEWFVKFKFPGHEKVRMVDSPLGKIPEGWEAVNIGSLIEEKKLRNREERNLPVLSVTNDRTFVLSEKYFSKRVYSKSLKNYKVVDQENFAFNPARINIGSMAILDNFDTGIVSPMYCVFSVIGDRTTPAFLWRMLNEARVFEQIKKLCFGTVRQIFKFQDFRLVKTVLPPIQHQITYESMIQPMEDLVKSLNSTIRNLRCTRDLLLPKLISGKIDVEDLDIDVGELAE